MSFTVWRAREAPRSHPPPQGDNLWARPWNWGLYGPRPMHFMFAMEFLLSRQREEGKTECLQISISLNLGDTSNNCYAVMWQLPAKCRAQSGQRKWAESIVGSVRENYMDRREKVAVQVTLLSPWGWHLLVLLARWTNLARQVISFIWASVPYELTSLSGCKSSRNESALGTMPVMQQNTDYFLCWLNPYNNPWREVVTLSHHIKQKMEVPKC